MPPFYWIQAKIQNSGLTLCAVVAYQYQSLVAASVIALR